MYKVTLILFAFFSLVFPILAVPVPVPNEIGELAQRATPGATASFTGRGTNYKPGLGACGQTNSENDFVVALPASIFDKAHCGQQVNIRHGGKSVQATAVDRCPGCGSQGLDMSPAVFKQLAAIEVGVIQVTWNFL